MGWAEGANLVAGRPRFSVRDSDVSCWGEITFKVIRDHLQFTPFDCRLPGC